LAIITDFDAPIFKVLANNDTGAAAGHQAGFVLPKDLEDYLPLLRNETSVDKPTVDIDITAELFDGPTYLGTAETRYQYQTWGGARSPERRITRNISELLNRAKGDDVLIIERGIQVDTHYRFRLIRDVNPLYPSLIQSFGGNRWGVLERTRPPAKETEVEEVAAQIELNLAEPFAMFEDNPAIIETQTRKVARSRAFQRLVFQAYQGVCSLCNGGLLHPSGRGEVDAAHIVSRSLRGSDDIRNGLLLCKAHHWAFDAGLVGISGEFGVIVPVGVQAIERNAALRELHGSPISLPERAESWPAPEALEWHRRNVMSLA
jgi:putative restriction endonuclease